MLLCRNFNRTRVPDSNQNLVLTFEKGYTRPRGVHGTHHGSPTPDPSRVRTPILVTYGLSMMMSTTESQHNETHAYGIRKAS